MIGHLRIIICIGALIFFFFLPLVGLGSLKLTELRTLVTQRYGLINWVWKQCVHYCVSAPWRVPGSVKSFDSTPSFGGGIRTQLHELSNKSSWFFTE